MDPLWLLVALLFGFLARQLRLPPLIGFLLAGFALHAMGVSGGAVLQTIAELGVTLLLFTIGLKLRLKSLMAPEVLFTAWTHLTLIVVMFSLLIWGASLGGWLQLQNTGWQSAATIAFALAFSSTVFAVKILEERGEVKTRHGQVAIGILIIQDLAAVLFMTFATDKMPSLWALGLLLLPLLRPLLNQFMERSGHGEVLVLFGMFMAIGGGELFSLLGLKADLGALVFGVLLSNQKKSVELSRSLMRFKDLFLVGFFLTIGINALPGWYEVIVALLLALLLPLKGWLFFYLMSRLKLRVRNSFLAMLVLSNYSEFGLIVAATGVSSGLIGSQWLVILALALSFSFVLGSLMNSRAHDLYALLENRLRAFETEQRLADDVQTDLGDAEVLIAGMGRVGHGAYLSMRENFGDKVIGIDADVVQVKKHQQVGYRVVLGDAEDGDFWRSVNTDRLKLVMLAMPALEDMKQAIKLLKETHYQGMVAAVAKYEDERQELKRLGVDAAYNFYAEAGSGFAKHVCNKIKQI